MHVRNDRPNAPTRQNGFTLVELMVALLIGLFLMGGLMALMQSNRHVFSSQNKLSQLQDGERLAMSMMTDVIEHSGYFPNPTLNTATSALSAVPGTFVAGQSVTGATGTPTGDTITVRFRTLQNDGNLFNCAGQSNIANPNPHTFVNKFSVETLPNSTIPQLICTPETGVRYPLVSNVQSMAVAYGVGTAGAVGNVDTYMTADQVTAAAAWSKVISVRVTLDFANPVYDLTNPQGQPPTVQIQRYITLMNASG